MDLRPSYSRPLLQERIPRSHTEAGFSRTYLLDHDARTGSCAHCMPSKNRAFFPISSDETGSRIGSRALGASPAAQIARESDHETHVLRSPLSCQRPSVPDTRGRGGMFVNARWQSSLLVLVSLFGLMVVLAAPSKCLRTAAEIGHQGLRRRQRDQVRIQARNRALQGRLSRMANGIRTANPKTTMVR